MSRIAKADVNAALQHAAKLIVEAGGKDGRTSRAEMKAALKTMAPKEKALADVFFKFIDHRDFKKGAQVTAKDVKAAVDYAKTHMVAKYDLNDNGLSKAEVAKMSLTGKRAVDLAKALKAAAAGGGATLPVAELTKALTTTGATFTYISESDYSPEGISGKPANAQGVTEANLKAAFGAKLADFFKDDGFALGDLAFDVESAAASKSFIAELGTPRVDDDDGYKEMAAGFAKLNGLVDQNLTDVRVVKVGQKDDDGSLAQDSGLYAYLVVGKAKDGQLAGYLYGSVET